MKMINQRHRKPVVIRTESESTLGAADPRKRAIGLVRQAGGGPRFKRRLLCRCGALGEYRCDRKCREVMCAKHRRAFGRKDLCARHRKAVR